MRISDWSSDVCSSDLRVLAIDHELAHHRHGDLWANAAALVLLAAQWFNPFAWRAIRAFRFDQEAACDARVLNMVDRDEAEGRGERTARYATAIVKARSEEHTSELQSLMRISYAVFCLKKKNKDKNIQTTRHKH